MRLLFFFAIFSAVCGIAEATVRRTSRGNDDPKRSKSSIFSIFTSTLYTRLYDKIESLQDTTDTKFIPFVQVQKRKGSFGSDIKLNFHGKFPLSLPRFLNCYDNNAFVPLWVTTVLVESWLYGDRKQLKKPNSMGIIQSLQLIEEHYDNLDAKNESTGAC
jgi:hypothetical protein